MNSLNISQQYSNEFITWDTPPRIIKAPSPSYPESAKKAGIEGRAYIQMFVDSGGKVIRALVGRTSGYASLDSAAIKASKGYIFAPAELRKKPIAVWVAVTIEFKLNDDEKRIPKSEDHVEYDTPPKPLETPSPQNPAIPKDIQTPGDPIVDLLIDLDGTVMRTQLKKSSGYKPLDEAVLEGARNFKFKPASNKGKSVRVWVTMPICIHWER